MGGIEYIHFSKRYTDDTLWKTSGMRCIPAMIQICGSGVAKGMDSHQEDDNAFTVSIQDKTNL